MVDRVVPSIEPRSLPPSEATSVSAEDEQALLRRELQAFMSSTPGRLTVVGLILIAITLIAGLLATAAIENRQANLDLLLVETEPLANSAQNLYSALSLADAAAATAFISGGLEPAEVRDRYTQSIGEASAEIVQASAGLDSTDLAGHSALTTISTDLSVYTGLVETARANNRVGNPVGAAYLSEASQLMQTSLLPMAQQLHASQETLVSQVQRDFETPPWWPIVAFVFVLCALVATQMYFSRKSRRRFNLGLILASLAVAAALLWLLTVGLVSALATGRALDAGAEPLHELTEARIMAQQARTVETLTLARRDSTAEDNVTFTRKVDALRDILEGLQSDERARVNSEVLTAALDSRQQWVAAHTRMYDRLGNGDFTSAAAITIGAGEQDSAAEYGKLDHELWQGIVDSRTNLRSDVSYASRVLAASAPGMSVLAVLGVAGNLHRILASTAGVSVTGVPVMRRKSPAVCVAVLAAAMLVLAGCGADRAEDLDNAGATSYTEPPLPAEAHHRSQPDTDDYRVVHQPHREPAAHPRRRISAATHAEPRRHPRPRAADRGPGHRFQPHELSRSGHRAPRGFRRGHRPRNRPRSAR